MDIQSASCLSHTKGVFTILHAVDDDVGHNHPSMVAFDNLLSGKKNHHSDGIVERYFIELNECVQKNIVNIGSVFSGDTKVLRQRHSMVMNGKSLILDNVPDSRTCCR